MEHYYEFAGIPVSVSADASDLYADHGVLEPYILSQPREIKHHFFFELVDQIYPIEEPSVFRDIGLQVYHSDGAVIRYAGTIGSTHMKIQRRGSQSMVSCLRSVYPSGISPKTVLNAMEAEHLMVRNGGFILHASFIRVGERAILFTAPSGTGKSTQADLWCRYRNAELINGDRAAVMVEDGRVYAYGIPFSGSSGVAKNARLPVSAIIYLSQAPRNSVEEWKGFQAFRKVWEGCSVNVWDREDVAQASKTVLDVLKVVPLLHLSCTPDQGAVDALAAILTQRGDL